MTFVGKILVLVVVALSFVFLGLSAVAVSTAKNWKAEIAGHQKNVTDLTKKLAEAKTQAENAGKVLEDAKVAFEQEKKSLDVRNTGIVDEIKRDEVQVKSTREQWAGAHERTKGLMSEVEAKRTQINELHEKIAAIKKQTREFKQYQLELTDLIRETERLLGTADENNADLKSR